MTGRGSNTSAMFARTAALKKQNKKQRARSSLLVCVCLFVCVRVCERGGEWEREGERQYHRGCIEGAVRKSHCGIASVQKSLSLWLGKEDLAPAQDPCSLPRATHGHDRHTTGTESALNRRHSHPTAPEASQAL